MNILMMLVQMVTCKLWNWDVHLLEGPGVDLQQVYQYIIQKRVQ